MGVAGAGQPVIPHRMSLTELEQEVRKLAPKDLAEFTRWLDTYTAAQWDNRFEQDVAAGKLDRLGRQADTDFEAGRCAEL